MLDFVEQKKTFAIKSGFDDTMGEPSNESLFTDDPEIAPPIFDDGDSGDVDDILDIEGSSTKSASGKCGKYLVKKSTSVSFQKNMTKNL